MPRRIDPDDPRLTAPDFPHGKIAGYVKGCSCTECRAVHNAANRDWRARQPRKHAPRVPARQSARYLKALLDFGSIGTIARASGVPRHTLRDILIDVDAGKKRTIQQATADAIRAVTPAAVADAAFQTTVPARYAAIQHHLLNLLAEDCTVAMIAEASGTAERVVSLALGGRHDCLRQADLRPLALVSVEDCYRAGKVVCSLRAVTRLRALQANWWPLEKLSALLGHDAAAIARSKRVTPEVDEDVQTLYVRLADEIGPDESVEDEATRLGFFPPDRYDANMRLIPEKSLDLDVVEKEHDRQERARLWFRIIGYTLREYSEHEIIEATGATSGIIQAARRTVGLRITRSRGHLDPFLEPGQRDAVAIVRQFLSPIAISERTEIVDEPLDYAAHWRAMVQALKDLRASKRTLDIPIPVVPAPVATAA